MKAGWKSRKIRDVVALRPPKAEARARLNPADNVSFVPMECLQVNSTSLVLDETRTLEAVVGGYTYFANGDVLLAKITPCFENGKLGIASGLTNGVGFGSSEFMVLRPTGDILSEWLYYFLARENFRVSGAARMTGAVGHKRVPPEYVEECTIPVPPLPEQRRIVALLDEAFEGIAKARANAEKNIENARAVFAARTDALFAQSDSRWPSRRLGEMAEFRNGINFTKSSRGDRVRIVGVKDFAGNVAVPFDQLAEVVTDGKLAAADKIRPNDILFVRSNGSTGLIGRCLLVEDVPHPTTHSGFTIRARLTSTDVLPEYLCRVLRSNATRQQMISGGIGANIKSLSQGVLAALPIPLPDTATQARIAAELQELEGTTESVSSLAVRKASTLDELKKSLLHHAFAGEL